MLFLCPRISNIWKSVGSILQIDIRWKHVVLGLNENNIINMAKNNVFTIISFCIYATWVKYHQPECTSSYGNVVFKHIVVSYLSNYKHIYQKFLHRKPWFNIFDKIVDELISVLIQT